LLNRAPPTRFNNVFHAVFYKLFVVAVRSNHTNSLKSIFNQTRFLSKLIEQHNSTETSGNKGYVLLICNMIRLTADTQAPGEFIPSMLSSHHQWLEFTPVLR